MIAPPRLSILTITKGEDHVGPFIRAMKDIADRSGGAIDFSIYFHPAPERGILEDVHDTALTITTGDYILRLDDDEMASPAMVAWLLAREYEHADHWKFPRAHLWQDSQTVIVTPQLWPDHQTRLSVRAKAGGRTSIHAGSPYGGGEVAPVTIEHHKFLVKTLDERRAQADYYDTRLAGAGRSGGMTAFQCPEDAYAGQSPPTAPTYGGSAAMIDAYIARTWPGGRA